MENAKIIKKAFGIYIEGKGAGDSHVAENLLTFYLEGLLDGEDKDKVEEHLACCGECLDLLLVLKEMESLPQEVPVPEILPPSWQERVKEILSPQSLYIGLKSFKENLEVLFTSGEVLGPGTPLLAVRGAPPNHPSQLVTVQKHFGSLQVEVEVEQVKGGEKELKVALTDRWTQKPRRGLVINLIKQSRILASYVSREGQALFRHLSAGLYYVKIYDQQGLTGMVILNIKGDSHEG